jgi:hypothetical protein
VVCNGEKVKPCNENIKKALELANNMIVPAEKGDADREDDGCGILYGVLRDSAYEIKQIADAGKERHIKKGWWKPTYEKLEHNHRKLGTKGIT